MKRKMDADKDYNDITRAIDTGDLLYLFSFLKRYNVNSQNSFGQTALFYVINQDEDYEIINLLLHSKADPNIQDSSGYTPLMLATGASILKLLIHNDANPDIRNKHGNTALMSQILYQNAEGVKILLNSRADPLIRNKIDETPLILAKKLRDFRIVNIVEYYLNVHIYNIKRTIDTDYSDPD